jgi:hypothetical protein
MARSLTKVTTEVKDAFRDLHYDIPHFSSRNSQLSPVNHRGRREHRGLAEKPHTYPYSRGLVRRACPPTPITIALQRRCHARRRYAPALRTGSHRRRSTWSNHQRSTRGAPSLGEVLTALTLLNSQPPVRRKPSGRRRLLSTSLLIPQSFSRSDFQRDQEASRASRFASEVSGASPALMNPCPAPG